VTSEKPKSESRKKGLLSFLLVYYLISIIMSLVLSLVFVFFIDSGTTGKAGFTFVIMEIFIFIGIIIATVMVVIKHQVLSLAQDKDDDTLDEQNTEQQQRKRWTIPHPYGPWIIVVLALVVSFILQNMCLLGWPRFLGGFSVYLLFMNLVFGFGFLASPICFIGYLVFSASKQCRLSGNSKKLINNSIAWLVYGVLFFMMMRASLKIRSNTFDKAGKRGETIITALEKYKSDKGEYPSELTGLVPDNLSEIPWTGIIGYPEYVYRRGDNDIQEIEGSYELRINCTSGGINFDRFIYWPNEKYPDTVQGNWIERIGKWAYVHE